MESLCERILVFQQVYKKYLQIKHSFFKCPNYRYHIKKDRKIFQLSFLNPIIHNTSPNEEITNPKFIPAPEETSKQTMPNKIIDIPNRKYFTFLTPIYKFNKVLSQMLGW